MWKQVVASIAIASMACDGLTLDDIVTSEIDMGYNFAMARGWTRRLSGQCGPRCRLARRMYTASCQDNLFVAWNSHTGWVEDPTVDGGGLGLTTSIGHLSQFQINSDGTSTVVKHVKYDECNEMGAVTVSEDCSVIAVLCRSGERDPQAPGTVDFVTDNKCCNSAGKDFLGWDYPSIKSDKHYKIVDAMYLYEYANNLNGAPVAKVWVNNAVGGGKGAEYGHYELSLNKDMSVYMINLKVTTYSTDGTGWHVGDLHVAMNRGEWTKNNDLSKDWACGPGHTFAHRLVYSSAQDMWARVCWTDWNKEKVANTYSILYDIVSKDRPSYKESVQLQSIPQDDPRPRPNIPLWAYWGTKWYGIGGVVTALPRGTEGFLVIALGVEPGTPRLTVGMAKVPAEPTDCSSTNDCTFKWKTELEGSGEWPFEKLGMVNAANFGTESTDDQKSIVVGWGGPTGTPTATSLGGLDNVADLFYLSMANTEGTLEGDAIELPVGVGWGEDNNWVHVPSSGCVAFVVGGSANMPYGPNNDQDTTDMSSTLKITTVCPEAVDSDPGCNTDEYLDEGTCVEKCPNARKYADEGICVKKCPEERFFASKGICVEKCEGHRGYIRGNKCVSKCSKDGNLPYYNLDNPDKMKCVKTCKKRPFHNADGKDTCVDKCPEGLYIDEIFKDHNDRIVKKCVEQCPADRPYANDRKCVSECPSGEKANSQNKCK